MPAAAFGRKIEPDAIRFERRLAARAERAWSALATGPGLATWLGEATVDLRVGGLWSVRLAAETVVDGRVTTYEPLRSLTISWHEIQDGEPLHHATAPDDRSDLEFVLEPEGEGTALSLEHRRVRGGEIMASYLAGWHASLDALSASLTGHALAPFAARYEMLYAAYAAQVQ